MTDCYITTNSNGRLVHCLFAVQYVSRLQSYLSSLEYGQLATLTGRYYAMDRDKRYERIKIAFEGLVKGEGERVSSGNLIQVTLYTLAFSGGYLP